MGNLTRKLQKVFAENSVNSGQFGSLQAGAGVPTTDTDVIQALAAFLNGWTAATISSEELPALEERQGLDFLMTRQIAYLLNKGIPEWEVGTEYFIGDIQREVAGTKLYRSEIDNNTGLDIAAIAYNAGTTYEIDEVAMDTNGDIYRSLTGGNIGNPLTDPVNWELAWEFLFEMGSTATGILKGLTIFPKQIIISNNITDPDHDIDFSAGNYLFDDESGQGIMGAEIGEIDALFGVGNGMLDAGVVAINQTYHLFGVTNLTTGISKPLASLSKTAPTLPAGFTKKKRLASIVTNASANILNGEYTFFGSSYRFTYDNPITDLIAGNPGISAVSRPLTVPPNTTALMVGELTDSTFGGATLRAYFSSLGNADVGAGGTPQLIAHGVVGTTAINSAPLEIKTDASSNIRSRLTISDVDINLSIFTYGFIDNIN